MKSRQKRPAKKAPPAESNRSDVAVPAAEPLPQAGVARRDFLKLSLTAGVALAAPMMFVRKATAQTGERVLKVVQWKHFVPDYDKWFNDVFVKEFGEA